MAHKRSLSISPSEVVFSGLKEGPQSITITIKNVDSRVRTVCVKPPCSSHIVLHGLEPTIRLAPGLDFSFQVAYDGYLEAKTQVRDKATIRTETDVIYLNISYNPPKTDIIVKGNLEFGVIAHETVGKKELYLVNQGEKEGSYKIEMDEGTPLKLHPRSGTVGPTWSSYNHVTIYAEIGGQEIGPITCEILLHIEGHSEPIKMMVAATVMKHSCQVINKHGAVVTEVDFGTLFYGETGKHKLQILNNGSKEIRCAVTFGNKFDMALPEEPDHEVKSENTEGSGASEDSEIAAVDTFAGFLQTARMKAKAREASDNPFTINPLATNIPPFQSSIITIFFKPENQRPSKGFTSNMDAMVNQSKPYDYIGQIEFGSSIDKCRFPLRGKAIESANCIRPSLLNFGDVPTSKHVDQTIDLSNKKSPLPVHFNIRKVCSSYSFNPSEGLIPPGKTIVVIVRFSPKSLGYHHSTIPIDVVSLTGTMIRRLKLTTYGVSMSLGPKQSLVGGPNRLPEDFEKDPIFLNNEKAENALKKKPFVRSNVWDTKENLELFNGIGTGTDSALGLDNYKKKKRHQTLYSDFIRKERDQKVSFNMTRKEADSDLDLGMDPRSGLKSPKLRLPIVIEPLWTEKVKENNEPRHLKPLAEDKIASMGFFKDRPGTESEKLVCSKPLGSHQLAKLGMGPQVVDFGRVSAASTNVQHYFVQNLLSLPVHIVLDVKSIAEFRRTKHTSQVIPPGAIAKFPLVLSTKEVKSIHQSVDFVINGNHFRSFTAEANVVAVSMDVSTNECIFRFDAHNWEPFVDQVLVLDNPQPFSCTYEWECSDKCFGIDPRAGTVSPKSSVQVNIRWTPKEGQQPGQYDAKMVLLLKGGSEPHKQVRLRAEFPEILLQFQDSGLDIGPVPCGVPQNRTVVLKNTGVQEAPFRVVGNSQLRCTPMKGKVAPGDTFEMDVSFTCMDEGKFSTVLEVETRYQKIMRYPVHAVPLVPNVQPDQGTFNFGQVCIGGSSRLPVKLTNTTPVPAVLTIDLSAYPYFELVLPRDNWKSEYEECPLKKAIKDSDTFSVCSTRCSKRVASGALDGLQTGKDGHKYQLSLKSIGSILLYISFRPTEECIHKHSLNILTSTGSSAAGSSFQIALEAEGLKPRLVFSTTRIDFGVQIVQRSRDLQVPYSGSVHVFNNHNRVIRFKLVEKKEENKILRVHPTDAALKPGESVHLSVLFVPSDAQSYEESIPIFLDDDKDASMELILTGTGQFPRLKFDRREVLLPAVPLNMRSEARFYILNDGFDNLELRYRLPPDSTHIPLSIEFPEGSLIGIAKGKLPVIVSFQAANPMSFTAAVHFLDEEGAPHSILVTGTTDNSILTVRPFLQENRSKLVWKEVKNGCVMLEDRNYSLPSCSKFGCTSSLKNVVRYLNSSGARQPFANIQQEAMQSRGRFIFDLIEQLGGKKLSRKALHISGSKKEIAQQMLGLYDWLLSYLKSNGFLLNVLKPQLLLDPEDFQKILQIKSSKIASTEDEDSLDHWQQVFDNFELISQQAWSVLVAQITKIFLVSQVTLKSLKEVLILESLPQINQKSLIGSNIYSLHESILLSWLTSHLKNKFPISQSCVTNFDVDIRDGLAIFSTLVNHWPPLNKYTQSIVKLPSEEAHWKINCEVVVRMLQELNLNFPIEGKEIYDPDSSEILVLVFYLFQTLPSLIPRETIEFSGRLGEKETKLIQLSNTCKKPLIYTTRLEGHADFSVDVSQIKIEPKSTAEMYVFCQPTISIYQESRLILTSRSDVGAHGVPLVFMLKSFVNVESPLKQIKTEVALYDHQRFEFIVMNPFLADCDFSISLYHESTIVGPQIPKKVVGKTSKKKNIDLEVDKRNDKAFEVAKFPMQFLDYSKESKIFPDAFGLDKIRVRLKQKGSDKLKGSFLPFTMGPHHCKVIFEDREYGKFCYEFVGEVTLPPVFAEHRFNVATSGTQVIDIYMPHVNHQLENARRIFQDKHPLGKDKDQLALLKSSRADKIGDSSTFFHINQSNSLISIANTLSVKAISHTQMGEDSNGLKRANSGQVNLSGPVDPGKPEMPNTLRLQLKPIGTGLYPCRIIMTSYRDVRVVDVEIHAQNLGETFSLEFATPAFHRVTQDIPLVNSTDKSIVVQATCTGLHFQGPREVVVPPGITGAYSLKFVAPWIGEYTGALELTISNSGEKNIYKLLGKSEEPLALDHLLFECQARTSTTKRLVVPNNLATPLEYKIYSDLNFVSGKDSLRIEGNGNSNYKITVTPPRSGKFYGSINFETEKGFYVWYSMEVRVSEPLELAVIHVQSRVREAASIGVQVKNPLTTMVNFKASYSSESLVGPLNIELAPNEDVLFQFFYAPLFPKKEKGTVSLISDEVGEFWYQLEMSGIKSSPEELSLFEAELGGICEKSIYFCNPLGKNVTICGSTSNPKNFKLSIEKAIVGPYEQLILQVIYEPASINKEEISSILIESQNAGAWEYLCTGKGLPPNKTQTKTLRSMLNSSTIEILDWKNPLSEDCKMSVSLIKTSSISFNLLLSTDKKIDVGASSSIQIPIEFTPSSLTMCEGELEIVSSFRIAGDLRWKYKLMGIVEMESHCGILKLKCKSRSEISRNFREKLEGLKNLSKEDAFSHEIFGCEENRNQILETLKVKIVEVENIKNEIYINLGMIYSPKSVMERKCQLLIQKSTGGRWVFDLHLQATPPTSDGTLLIESPINEMTFVPIPIFAKTATPERFTASFSPDSSKDFIVKPIEGILSCELIDGYEEKSPSLHVGYSCKESGKCSIAHLFVDTSIEQYVYTLKGRQRCYKPPDKSLVKSKVDHMLDASIQTTLMKSQHNNFVLSNKRMTKAHQ